MTALRVHGDTLVSPGQLDYAVNIWPEQRPRRGDSYPDERAARAAVARRHGRDPSEVLLTNGACEAFWLFAHALRPRRFPGCGWKRDAVHDDDFAAHVAAQKVRFAAGPNIDRFETQSTTRR